MIFSILLLLIIAFLAYKASPKEKKEDAHVHGAGQIGLLAAVALFGVDYFTSFYYATGEMMSALHPYGLQQYAYVTAAVIAFGNLVFGALYMYSLGIFNEGGGSYTASMRYLWPTLSLIVAVTLIQDYVLTIVVSALSGADQLLSVFNAFSADWIWHFGIGAFLAATTWYLTIRGRGESARFTFGMLAIFIMLTLVMVFGLIYANINGVAAAPNLETPQSVPMAQALLHLLTASMKGMVALTGLEAMSNGIQFVIDEDFQLVKWGKKKLPNLNWLWNFYSGKAGIGRMVQTSFLFYGGLTTYFLTFFAIRFNVYDGSLGRSLVGNLAKIGFSTLPGGDILYWAYQILAVILLAGASMTAFQDAQATEWRDVSIGEIPEVIVYPFGDDYIWNCRCHYVIGSRRNIGCRTLLRRGRLYAHHGHGPGHPAAYIKTFHRKSSPVGFDRSDIRGSDVRDCFCGPDYWKMVRRGLGGADFVQCPGNPGAYDAAFPAGVP